MAELPVQISTGVVQARVDAAQLPALKGRDWALSGGTKGRPYVTTRIEADGEKKTLYLHRVVSGAQDPKTGEAKKIVQVDHQDGDRLNNQGKNLRNSTHSQNGANVGKRGGTTSSYKGVSLNAAMNRYKATIHHEGKEHHLGYFRTQKQAAQAYDDAAKKFHGEFAKLNLSDE